MSQPEHRRSERLPEVFPVLVTTAEAIAIEGKSLDVSRSGLLLTAQGQIWVQLEFKGKRYRGRLVRVFPLMGTGETAYGIELEETLSL